MAARIELDLRIGAAFTRLQTLQLQRVAAILDGLTISYGMLSGLYSILAVSISNFPGSCQFPTLGFVVERYWRVMNFKPEKFWSIKIMHLRNEIKVNFLWRRVHLFDRAAVTVMLERCLAAKMAKVTKVNQKPTSKWRPLPLTTVDLQMMGSKYLRMDSQAIMKVFESLLRDSFMLLTISRSRKTFTPKVSLAIQERRPINLIKEST